MHWKSAPHPHVLAEVLQGVHLSGGVDGDRNAVVVGHLDGVLQGQGAGVGRLLHHVVVDRRCVGADGLLQVLARGAVVGAELHQLGSRQLQAAVVPVALPALDQDLVLHAGGVRELLDPVIVVSGHDRSRGQRQRRPRAGGDVGRRNVDDVGDGLPGLLLELYEGYVGDVGLLHSLLDLRNRRGASQHRDAADGVDDGLRSKLLVDCAPAGFTHP